MVPTIITYFLVCFHNSIYMKDCPFCCRCPFVPYQLSLKDTIHNTFEPSLMNTSSDADTFCPFSYKQCMEYFMVPDFTK